MKWFLNMKIRAKMLTAFAIVIVLTIALGFMGLFGMIRMKASMTNEAQNLLPEVQALMSIKECQTAIVASERMLSHPGLDQDTRSGQYDVIVDQQQQIRDSSDLYVKLDVSADDKKAWNDYKALQTVFMGDADKYLEISRGIDAEGEKNVNPEEYSQLVPLTEDPYDAVDVALDNMTDAAAKESEAVNVGTDNFSSLMIYLFVGLIAISTAVALLLSIGVSGQISKSIGKLLAGAEKLSEGDLNVNMDIATNDEVGILAKAFRSVSEAISSLIADVNGLLAAAEDGNLSERADASRHKGEFSNIIEGFNRTLDAIIQPVQEVTSVLKKTAVNDLSGEIKGSYKGDMQELTGAMSSTVIRLKSIQSIFVNLSKGDLTQLDGFQRVGKRSENDVMLPAVIIMMQTLTDVANEANMLSNEAANGNLNIRGDASKYEGIFRQLINGINGLIDAMVAPLNDAMGVLDTMANNDFTSSMSEEYDGSFAELSRSVNSVLETMNQTLGDINTAAEQVAAGTQQVSAGSQALSQGATEQASATEQLTSSLTEIASQTRQNALNAGQASELAVTARNDAVDGNTRMKELQAAMNGINDASQNISKIIKVIDNIAFQTNLLALNAAVEAARAGQYGKGFAVVAEEVRSLAQRSAGAAKETTSMIEESIKKVKAGTKIANDTAQALDRIVGGVEKAAELVGGIAKASNEQATAVAQVNKGIEQVAQVTQTNSATAEESAAASEELSSQAELLKEMVGHFSLRGQSMAGGSKAAFQPKQAAKALPGGKPSTVPAGKPRISLNDREFGKY